MTFIRYLIQVMACLAPGLETCFTAYIIFPANYPNPLFGTFLIIFKMFGGWKPTTKYERFLIQPMVHLKRIDTHLLNLLKSNNI